MRITSLGYLTDLAVRLAEGSEITDRRDHLVIRTPQNPGYWWGNFLLLGKAPARHELAGWMELFEAEFPAAAHRAFGLDVTSAATADATVFLAAGFQAQRNVVLTARSVGPARPPDLPVVVRRLTGDEDWRQSASVRRACGEAEPGPEHEEFEYRKLAARRRLTEQGRGAWFGAFADGRMAAQLGVVSSGDGLARYQDVETHPGYRRRGLAGALLTVAAQWARSECGAQQLVIVADPGYHAVRLYQSLGFRIVQDQTGFQRVP